MENKEGRIDIIILFVLTNRLSVDTKLHPGNGYNNVNFLQKRQQIESRILTFHNLLCFNKKERKKLVLLV